MKKALLALSAIFIVLTTSAQNSGIEYRSDNGYSARMCRINLYTPPDQSDFATVVWFHGGGLSGGRNDIPELLVGKGFAVASAGYRLSPEVEVEQCIDDAAAAVRWVVDNIANYGGDSKKIFVAGHSAGGYLSAMIGLDKRWLGKYNIDPDTSIMALLPYSGQMITHFTRRQEVGMGALNPLVDSLAPLFHVRAECPPMILTTGDRDDELYGRYEENAYFWRMMNLVGHKATTLYELDGFNHSSMCQPAHMITVKYINDRLKAKAAEQQ